ncbi:MAG: hypothetical protein RL748_2095 [Pseudomonadota bacterium]
MARIALWLFAAVLTVFLTVLFFLPAATLVEIVEKQTAGRLTLGEPQGTLWHGSAFIGGAAAGNAPVTPLLPGRFSWQLSPLVLLGKVQMRLENPAALSQPVELSGSWSEWQVSAGSITQPAERLAGLGAPLNTLNPSGQMRVSWNTLNLARQGQQVDLRGQTTVELNDIGSALSSIKPLGSYKLTMQWEGQQAQLNLETVKGALLLSGKGRLAGGQFEFSGKADAARGEEERLANLLNLLGQRRQEGDKTIIALEFRQ